MNHRGPFPRDEAMLLNILAIFRGWRETLTSTRLARSEGPMLQRGSVWTRGFRLSVTGPNFPISWCDGLENYLPR